MTIRPAAFVTAGSIAFAVLATLNSGGYRYGAADQAFYIPAILRALDPSLFPRDSALIAPQARYFFIDEIIAGGIRLFGGSIEGWFLGGYLLTVIGLALALIALGRTVFTSPLSVTALLAIYTLKHRIAKTGVNTLEGYFHPRVLVFAAGVAAIMLYLRGRPWAALLLVAIAGLLHPTTAAFFVLLIGIATWVTVPRARMALTLIGIAGAGAVGWLVLAGPWQHALAPMDLEWRQLLSTKDYLFPATDWSIGVWLINLGTAAVALVGLARAGASQRGLLVGAAALLALFLITLPAVQYGIALAVQLQISRVFWLLELLAVISVVWWLVDRPASVRRAEALASATRRPGLKSWPSVLITFVLVAASVIRGGYVSFVEREPAVFRYSLPESDWTNALRWIQANTPTDAHILTDPGHAFLYGYPVRFIGRDVYLEDVKDSAMALYDRAAAARVIARRRDLGDFSTLSADRAGRLAATYHLDYLVTTQPTDLPEAGPIGRFHIYRLVSGGSEDPPLRP